MNKHSVFISYSRRDADLAKAVESALERLGLKAFNPASDMRAGDDWRKSIQAAIKRSDALIMLVGSPHNLSTSWTSYEIGIAEALGKRIMVLLPSRFPVAELPAEVRSVQVVDFDPKAPERAARDIAARLAAA
ncbi:MAG: toll/interleukin-1 receptor domain-containing protein [Deltaproteobacteria bacterium]|nr:toll/interleukin-1 receptor domain-containing protein [Deltaproteobacteria bacterium]